MGRPSLVQLDDWLFGSRARRWLLSVVTDPAETGPWRQVDLARRVGVADKGTIEWPMRRLEELGLVARREDGLWQPGANGRLAKAVHLFLVELKRTLAE